MRTYIRSKLYEATVTDAILEYEGSVTIDEELLELADIHPGEKVLIVNKTNGNRLETYTIPGERYSGIIQINGAASHLMHKGDEVVIMAFEHSATPIVKPRTVYLREGNQVKYHV